MASPPPKDESEQAGPEDAPAENPYWREPPPPPDIPELLQRPVDHPAASRKPDAVTDLTGFGKAWGTALDFVVTILAGTGLGWLGGKYIGPPSVWVLGGLALGFAVALVRIVRSTLRDDREEQARKRR